MRRWLGLRCPTCSARIARLDVFARRTDVACSACGSRLAVTGGDRCFRYFFAACALLDVLLAPAPLVWGMPLILISNALIYLAARNRFVRVIADEPTP